MTDAKQCDCCERFAPPLEVLTLEARTPRLAGDGSIEYDHWSEVDICRSCLACPMGEVLAKACDDFEFISESAIGTECPGCGDWHRDGHAACGCTHCLPEHEGVAAFTRAFDELRRDVIEFGAGFASYARAASEGSTVAPVRPARAARAEAWRRSGSDYVVTIGPCEHGPFTGERTAVTFRDALNARLDAEQRVAELEKEVGILKDRLDVETRARREYSDRLGDVIQAATTPRVES